MAVWLISCFVCWMLEVLAGNMKANNAAVGMAASRGKNLRIIRIVGRKVGNRRGVTKCMLWVVLR